MTKLFKGFKCHVYEFYTFFIVLKNRLEKPFSISKIDNFERPLVGFLYMVCKGSVLSQLIV